MGTVNQLTKQPIKGRKLGGGIRFGEMERDSLLAHGAAYLLHDRLHACSDYHTMDVCTKCAAGLSFWGAILLFGGSRVRSHARARVGCGRVRRPPVDPPSPCPPPPPACTACAA